MAEQIISLAAAALILIAYGAHQAGKLRSDSFLYLLLNLVGAGILAMIAFRIKQLGLTVVESAWTLISVAALIRNVLQEKPQKRKDPS